MHACRATHLAACMCLSAGTTASPKSMDPAAYDLSSGAGCCEDDNPLSCVSCDPSCEPQAANKPRSAIGPASEATPHREEVRRIMAAR
jgi:hypothetical protein